MQKVDFSHLHELLVSLKASIPEDTSKPMYYDYNNVSPDHLHKMDLILKGEKRYLVAGNIPCHCHDGYNSERSGGYPMAIPCNHCYTLKKGLQRIQRAHLPNDAYECSIENYIFDSQVQEQLVSEVITAKKAANIVPPSMFMYGGAGNGKSTISYIMSKYLCLNGYRVKYIHHYHEFQKEKKSWSSNESHLDKLLDNVDVLVFDEFGGLGGRTHYSDWFTYTTIELIGIMYEKFRAGQLSIIMTSNMTPDLIFNKLLDKNAMALSRLQNIFGNPLHIKGPDRRPKGNQVSSWIN